MTALVLDRGRLRLADRLLVYPERALAPPGPLPAGEAPRPCGLTPLVADPAAAPGRRDVVLAPVGDGETLWLGFEAVEREGEGEGEGEAIRVRVRVEGGGHVAVDAVSGRPWREGPPVSGGDHLCCPPQTRLVGVPGAGGVRPFGTGGLPERVVVVAWAPEPVAVAIELVTPDVFTRRTGCAPAPLDPGAAYRGERLP